MKKDILGHFGPDRTVAPRPMGKTEATTPKPLPYSPPVGPKGQMHQAPGLGGTNHGNCGTQGRR